MKKTILFLVIVLLFSCPSIQAKMSMRIISRNKRSHEEKTAADNEVKKEVTKAVEATGASEVTETADVEEVVGTVEAVEAKEAIEAVEAREVTETKEATETVEVTEAKETIEAADAIESVEVEEAEEEIEVAEATEVIEATEAVEAVEAVEAKEVTEIKEATEATVTSEITEAVGVDAVAGAVEVTETVEATQAKMPMRIISRYKRLYEEKAVADNGEKKEATKSAVVEETETSEVTKAADVDEVAGTMEVAETAEAVDAIEAASVEEVKEEVEVIEATKTPEATEAAEVAGTTEVEEAKAAEAIEAVEAREAREVRETKEATEVTEAKETVEVPENTEATEVTEAIKPVEVKELTETGPVDYEALGLRSVELNPNDYPDEVIALLEPHKNSESNNSVLFYSSLGLAYKSKGRLKAAIAAYKRALKLVPNVPAPSIQYNLGIAYYYNNELHKSFNCFLNSSAQRSNHLGTEKWIKQLADELDIYKVPNTSKLKLVVNQKISVNRKKDDRESRIRMYLTQDGGRIQELSVAGKIYSYGIDSDTKRPVDYIIIDNDGDGSFDNVINTKGKFGVPTWAYNPE